jgi:hypothetical protein
MKARATIAVAAAAAAGAAAARRRARRANTGGSRAGGATSAPASYVVTVNKPADQLHTDMGLVEPLALLAKEYEVTVRPGRREALSVVGVRATDPEAKLRLREAKQLIETGEVLHAEGQPEGRRSAVGGRALAPAKKLMREGIS